MTLAEVRKKHPREWIVLMPSSRDRRGFVRSWKVINTAHSFDEAEKLYDFYIKDGLVGACLYDTGEDENEFQSGVAARFMRVFYGQDVDVNEEMFVSWLKFLIVYYGLA